ncbi:MAG TPA: cytochrome c biogenesis protein CcsA [Terriglobia bacterium]|nr:cytochrome c biogenesis protein CcsA [Terriglobia bacterium]
MHPGLLWCALALYGLGIVLALPSIALGRAPLSSAALTALSLGLILNAASLVVAALRLHRLPVIDIQSALSFFAFNTTLAFFLAYRRYKVTWLGVLILPFVFLMTLAAALNPGHPFTASTLRGGWLVVHVSGMILGYTGLFLTFVAAVMYLLQESELKSKHPKSLYYRLPSLEICDRIYDRSLVFGLICLSVGILTGCIWASRAWRGPWELDPKILASLLTWFIYLLLFSTRFSGSWRGRRSAYVAILGFAAMMVTFLGVSFLSAQHGYFPTIHQIH